MGRAAENENFSLRRKMKPGLGSRGISYKKEFFSGRHLRTRALRVSLVLLFSLAVTPITCPLSLSSYQVGFAFAEQGEADLGDNSDGRPVRRAPDGTEIVDYISELEQSNDALEQQIRSLKEQLARQNGGPPQISGNTASNSIKEQDLLGASPKQVQKDISDFSKRDGADGPVVEAKGVEFREINGPTESGIKPSSESRPGVGNSQVVNIDQSAGGLNQVNPRQNIISESQEDTRRIVVQQEKDITEVEVDSKLDQPRYIPPVLPIVADDDQKELLVDPSSSAQSSDTSRSGAPEDGATVDEPTSVSPVRVQQVRARLSSTDNVDDLGLQDDQLGSEQEGHLADERNRASNLHSQVSELQAVVVPEEHNTQNDSNIYPSRSLDDSSYRALSNDPGLIEAKRRVRTDISTLISLVATREQLFRRYGSLGGQIQVSPSRLITQRGQTVESVRGRQEEARTIRDWKSIEADVAELRKIAEKDISFIRRFSRRNSG